MLLKNKPHKETNNISIMSIIDMCLQDMNLHKLFPVIKLHFNRLRIQSDSNIKYI